MKHDREITISFLEAYNRATGCTYTIKTWVEDEERQKPVVEAIAKDNDGKTLAIEHTTLQAFLGQKADDQPFTAALAPLQDAGRAIPEHVLTLVFEAGAVPKGVDWADVSRKVLEWYEKIRLLLPTGESEQQVMQDPFTLQVHVEKALLYPEAPGFLFVQRLLPSDALLPVLREVLARKLTKLLATPAQNRLLLLEKDHGAHGYVEVSRNLAELAREFPELTTLDEIWVANTVSWSTSHAMFCYRVFPGIGVSRRFNNLAAD